MKKSPLQVIEFNGQEFTRALNETKINLGYVVAHVQDTADKAIVDAIVQAAKEAGIAKLYLIDKPFILAAIKENIERDGVRNDGNND